MKKILFSLIVVTVSIQSNAQSLKVWFNKPASQWEETLPLGNGRLGMTPTSGVIDEKIVLNDITLWSGAPQDANNYEAYKSLPKIRSLLAEGKNDEAQALIDKNFICKGIGSGGVPFGCYQMLGDLDIRFNYAQQLSEADVKEYYRELSLDNAVAKCSYRIGGVTYHREYITSFGTDVCMVRLWADKPGQISCNIKLTRPEKSKTDVTKNTLQMEGELNSGTAEPGMQYLAKVQAKLTGGKLNANGNTLEIKNANEVVLYVSACTNYKNSAYKNYITKQLNEAFNGNYNLQKKQHITKYQKLFNRVNVKIGNNTAAQLPTNERLAAFRTTPDKDLALPVLFYQFGRYLSISSTRVGLLPPNLQGLWANQVQTPWNGDYHLDVNVQMNHWPLEVSNLSELNLPLAELVKGMVKPGERSAKAYYNADGWVAHVITNIWGFTEPGESASWGVTKSGSGWLCNNLWEHYAFSEDKNYLKTIYPILKGSAMFYSSMLIHDQKTGWLVTSPSSSPENSFYLPNGKTASICEGPTIDNQIIRELFANVITAAKALNTDKALVKSLEYKLKQLPPAGMVAKDGRLMEWLHEYKETDPQHRHISHLYGLFPAPLITPELTPELAEACKKTLDVRGDDGPSWSIAYKQLFWARLHDGNRAYKLFKEIMKPTLKTDINYGAGGGVYPNLLSAGPPFQIDGNFGAAAGIAEMLIQSHAGFIELLPAIPDQWKTSGSVSGIKGRGNVTLSFTWKNGKVTAYKVTAPDARRVKIKVNGVLKQVVITKA
ncbi:glycoside hydrolase family 95 protein [Mucilaginibacter terrae]|uniref:Alpha-L-fucosidase 2 n=1 Tax=Mucilaginibacter terrae TaxID=1955052 RepID=A0ABU3H038_9SPHI|nr:glycoside hydrolase family 95 protein [Mucilaginibacter terrae]MDT3405383.1 alpha-L-fucosidase 2 [Mucilaginibacter terrae]